MTSGVQIGKRLPMRLHVAHGLAILALALAPRAMADDAPDVVVSIQPIHALVAGVMKGIGEPVLIVEGAGSPHTYALRPSEAGALQDAELVVWVGESMETFLSGSIVTLAPHALVLELMEAPGVQVVGFGEGEAWETGEHDDDAEHGSHDRHGADGHIWLDPDNAKAIVVAVVAQLVELDPTNADGYAANGVEMADSIDALAADVEARLLPVSGRPYVVFHDAYRYFDQHFDIRAVGSVVLSPDRQPGAARISAIRQRLLDDEVVCVFREPQFSPRVIETIIEGTDVRVGVLDPLGAELAPGPDLYGQLMMGIADGLAECLEGAADRDQPAVR